MPSIRSSTAVVLIAAAGLQLLAGPAARFAFADPQLASLAALYARGGLWCLLLPLACAALYVRAASTQMKKWLIASAPKVLLGVSIYYLLAIISLSLLKWRAMHYYVDTATHLEILWRSTQGLGLTTPMSETYHGAAHWFAVHFTPILYLTIWPFFKLVPSESTLIVLHAIYLASAAIPIALYARERLGNSGYWVAAAYLLYPTVHYIGIYGPAYLELSIPILSWAFYFLHNRRWPQYALFIALALLVREEVGFAVFALGLYAYFSRKERWAGALTALAGLTYAVVAIKVIIPSFHTHTELIYRNYVSWGPNPRAIAINVLTHPLTALAAILSPMRLANALMYLLPLGFMPLLAPSVLLIAVPSAALTFMSDFIQNYSFTMYYQSPCIPFLFFAAVEGVRRLAQGLERTNAASAQPIVWEPIVSFSLFVAALSAQIFFGPSPLGVQFWDPTYRVGVFHTTNYHYTDYIRTPHAEKALAMAAQVPLDCPVSAEQYFLPRLYDRPRMLAFPSLDDGIRCVLIDRNNPARTGWAETYLDFRRRPEYYYGLIEKDPRWRLAASSDGIMLFTRDNTL